MEEGRILLEILLCDGCTLKPWPPPPPNPGRVEEGRILFEILLCDGCTLKPWPPPPPNPGRVEEGRILSEIGILFVEGFETTGHTISWTLLNIASSPGSKAIVHLASGACRHHGLDNQTAFRLPDAFAPPMLGYVAATTPLTPSTYIT